MSNLSDVLIALGLIAAFAVVFIGLMRFHKATSKKDVRSDSGDGSSFMTFGGDAGSCDGGGCGGGD